MKRQLKNENGGSQFNFLPLPSCIFRKKDSMLKMGYWVVVKINGQRLCMRIIMGGMLIWRQTMKRCYYICTHTHTGMLMLCLSPSLRFLFFFCLEYYIRVGLLTNAAAFNYIHMNALSCVYSLGKMSNNSH